MVSLVPTGGLDGRAGLEAGGHDELDVLARPPRPSALPGHGARRDRDADVRRGRRIRIRHARPQ